MLDMNLAWTSLVLFFTFAAAANQPKCSPVCGGSHGLAGVPGVPGLAGKDGMPGAKGDVGSVRPKGAPVEKGSAGLNGGLYTNWNQCAWDRQDDKNIGLIQDGVFNKKRSDSFLKVFYGGNLRIYNCNACCKRWYFTFNGAECKNPLAIDGVFYMRNGAGGHGSIHRHRHIEGYCNGIPRGIVRVGFWVGNCKGYGNADASSVGTPYLVLWFKKFHRRKLD